MSANIKRFADHTILEAQLAAAAVTEFHSEFPHASHRGSGNGAAGFELDHIDSDLTSKKDIILLAQSKASKDPKENFVLVPESQLTHLSNIKHLPEEEILQADMVYFTVPGGGSVFSTGSITFCGSLPWNNFDNNVSKLLENIIKKSIS